MASPITGLQFNADGTRLAIGARGSARHQPTLTWLNPLAPKQAQVLCYDFDKSESRQGNGGIIGLLIDAGKLIYLEQHDTVLQLFYQCWDPTTNLTETLLMVPVRGRPGTMPGQGPLLVLPTIPQSLFDLRVHQTVASPPVLPGWHWMADDAQHLLALAVEQPLVRRYALDSWAVTQEYQLLPGPYGAAIAYTSASYCYAIGMPAKGLYVWEKLSGQLVPQLAHLREETVFSACISHDEKLIAVGYQTFIEVYEVTSGRLLYQETLHRGRVRALAFSPADAYLASGGEHGDVCISRLGPLS